MGGEDMRANRAGGSAAIASSEGAAGSAGAVHSRGVGERARSMPGPNLSAHGNSAAGARPCPDSPGSAPPRRAPPSPRRCLAAHHRSGTHDVSRRRGTSRRRRCAPRPTSVAGPRCRRRGSGPPRGGCGASRPPRRRPLACSSPAEPQQHRVAAELQQGTPALVGIGQERREARVDGVDQMLGSLLAATSQALGQPGEAGHVGEHHRAVERLDRTPRSGLGSRPSSMRGTYALASRSLDPRHWPGRRPQLE